MRPVCLDYRRPPTAKWPGMVFLGLSLLVTGYVLDRYWQLSTALAAAQDAALKITSEHRNAMLPILMGGPPTATQRRALERAQGTIARLTVPWESLFETLEHARSSQVALLGLTPLVEDRTISLVGEAKDYDAVLNYVQQLQETPAFTDVYLLHHQTEKQAPLQPLHFELRAHWKTS